jgi:phosphatidate cytidylyltransferase
VLPAWVILAFMHSRGALGPELALTALALVWAADVGAYAAGRSFGRIKLAPRVSPGKTWEGVTGGLTLALIVALAVSFWLGLPALPLAVVAVATALISVVGDLTVSMLKRNVGLKDTGKLLPGHGGVMDRIDGLVAAVPVYAVGLRVCGVLG